MPKASFNEFREDLECGWAGHSVEVLLSKCIDGGPPTTEPRSTPPSTDAAQPKTCRE